ncbi:MAG: tetratricopeptide repeat protein [Acidobacteria bacterium]|nr:MAG: tetratricopeptide repeat protein [Acidobacteriota bacterium]
MTLVAHTIHVREKSVERTQYFKTGIALDPSEYECDPNYGYHPKPGTYDDYKTVREVIEAFPSTLGRQSHVQVLLEFADDNGARLPPGIYWIRAALNLVPLGLRLPPSHVKTVTDISGPWEIRQVRTPGDQVNYHWIRAQYALREGNRVAAEQELLVATAVAPDSIRAWLNLGQYYERQGQYDKAIAAYKRAKVISERKELRPPRDSERPMMREVDGRLLFEPVYRPGMIERVREKQRAARLGQRKR